MPASRLALSFRRLRRRFSIEAPRVAVRAEIPWVWVGAGGGILLFFLLTGAYSWGRWAGAPDAVNEVARLQAEESTLREELVALKQKVGELESAKGIDQGAQVQQAEQLRRLESENAALKQELALMEGLAARNSDGGKTPRLTAPSAGAELSIKDLWIGPQGDAGSGRYRYRMFIAAKSSGGTIKGSLQMVLHLVRDGAKVDQILTGDAASGGREFGFEMRSLLRKDGVFTVPGGATLHSVDVRIVQDGTVIATQTYTLER